VSEAFQLPWTFAVISRSGNEVRGDPRCQGGWNRRTYDMV
jgi:hypothetical protein